MGVDKDPGSKISGKRDVCTAKDLTYLWRCMTLALKGWGTPLFSAAKPSLVDG